METFVERQARYAEMRKIDSIATYERRLAEQYADLKSDGSWSTPGEVTLHDVLMFIWVVAGEVGSSLMSGEDDERFASALAASRVSLPQSTDLQNRMFSLPQFEHAGT